MHITLYTNFHNDNEYTGFISRMCIYTFKYIKRYKLCSSKYLNLKRTVKNMSFVSRLMLIILLNKAYTRNIRDTEVILLPIWDSKGAPEVRYP